jgi:hypothetical protein
MTVVDILCFDSPLKVPRRILQQGPAEDFVSPGINCVVTGSGPPRRQRSHSAPKSSVFSSPDAAELSWQSAGNIIATASSFTDGDFAAHDGDSLLLPSHADGSSMHPTGLRAEISSVRETTSLPSPAGWERASEGSPFLLDDDVDDIVLEEVVDNDDDQQQQGDMLGVGRAARAASSLSLSSSSSAASPRRRGAADITLNVSEATPQPPSNSVLEAYSPATISLIVCDDDAKHEMQLYLDRAAALMHDVFVQRGVALFSNYCLSQSMITAVQFEEWHERHVVYVIRDAFVRVTIESFTRAAARIQQAEAASMAAVAKTPPPSQKLGNAGRRRQYLVAAAGGPPQAALPN